MTKKTIIEALQVEVNKNKVISNDAIYEIAGRLNKSVSEVYGVATFYTQFRNKITAKYTLEVCLGTACFVLGADKILETIKARLGIIPGEATADGLFYLSTARCLGCCGLAPVVSVNGQVYPKVTPKVINEILESLLKEKK